MRHLQFSSISNMFKGVVDYARTQHSMEALPSDNSRATSSPNSTSTIVDAVKRLNFLRQDDILWHTAISAPSPQSPSSESTVLNDSVSLFFQNWLDGDYAYLESFVPLLIRLFLDAIRETQEYQSDSDPHVLRLSNFENCKTPEDIKDVLKHFAG